MSHSTVLVIGPNYEEQLAPFDETLEVAPYPVPLHAQDVTLMLKYYCMEGKAPQQRVAVRARYDYATGFVLGISLTELQQLYYSWSSKELCVADTRLNDHSAYTYLSTYNPRSRWDWYSVGGRWTGFYKLKPGRRGSVGEPGLQTKKAEPGYADRCRKADVDVEGMRAEAEAEAATRYDRAALIIGGRTFAPWSEFLRDVDAERTGIDAARAAYNAQEVVQAFKAAGREWAFADIEPFLADREAYLRRARDGALTTFAVLQDGEWHERGKMGWFGVVADEQDDDRWAAEYARRFDALPADALLTVVDVHI